MFRRALTLLALVSSAFMTQVALAEPTTGAVKVVEVRPYNVQGAPGAIYVRIDQISLCNTDTYKIDLTWSGSKEVLAAALAALIADKPVKVEVVGSACIGFATPIQSLYILK